MKKTLTYQEARELQFFCRNVTGISERFYKLDHDLSIYKAKLDRLDKTRQLIEKHFGDQFSKEVNDLTEGKEPIL